MDYAAAKTIFTEVAPNLILNPDTGMAHIVVRKPGKGAQPFSIMLPDCAGLMADAEPAEITAAERKILLDAFAVAER